MFFSFPSGSGPLSYQWLHAGVPLARATNSTLSFTRLRPEDAGAYNLAVSSPYGTYTSRAPAILKLLDAPPMITLQPAAQEVRTGDEVRFRVAALGTGPLGYQWRRDTQRIEGATNATLMLRGVTAAANGGYAVTVSNPLGTQTSATASLTVRRLAEATFPEDRAVLFGSDVTLQAPDVGFAPATYSWLQTRLGIPTAVRLGATQASLTISNSSPFQISAYDFRTWADYSVKISGAGGLLTNSRATTLSTFPAMPALLPVELTGWSHDVIMENGPHPQADVGFDDSPKPYHAWFETGFRGRGDGLPPSRRLASAKDTNVVFELQPYAGPNCLWLKAKDFTNQTATLRLAQPASYSRLALLAGSTFSTSDGPPGYFVLQFTDGGSSDAIPLNCPDWWGGIFSRSVTALGGLSEAFADALSVTTNKVTFTYPQGEATYGLCLYQTDVDLAALGLADKQLAAITFRAPKVGQPTGIFAVSGREIESPGRPYFVADPAAQLVQSGGQLRLTCLAVGEPPIEYQWLKDGAAIPDASGPVLSLDPVVAGDAARYTVVAKNEVGTALSATAVIEVSGPPTLAITSPNGQPVLAWPDGDFVLEQRSTLGPDTGWEPVTTGIVTAAGQSTYEIDPTDDAHFFRLRPR